MRKFKHIMASILKIFVKIKKFISRIFKLMWECLKEGLRFLELSFTPKAVIVIRMDDLHQRIQELRVHHEYVMDRLSVLMDTVGDLQQIIIQDKVRQQMSIDLKLSE
jgi:hypothetical protein